MASGMHCGLCGKVYTEDETADQHNAREHPAIMRVLEGSAVERGVGITDVNRTFGFWRRLAATVFGNFAFARRLLGGHWERWHVGEYGQLMWLDTNRCSRVMGTRPPYCFGTPTCEHHG